MAICIDHVKIHVGYSSSPNYNTSISTAATNSEPLDIKYTVFILTISGGNSDNNYWGYYLPNPSNTYSGYTINIRNNVISGSGQGRYNVLTTLEGKTNTAAQSFLTYNSQAGKEGLPIAEYYGGNEYNVTLYAINNIFIRMEVWNGGRLSKLDMGPNICGLILIQMLTAIRHRIGLRSPSTEPSSMRIN